MKRRARTGGEVRDSSARSVLAPAAGAIHTAPWPSAVPLRSAVEKVPVTGVEAVSAESHHVTWAS
jgi:hypothetical protein